MNQITSFNEAESKIFILKFLRIPTGSQPVPAFRKSIAVVNYSSVSRDFFTWSEKSRKLTFPWLNVVSGNVRALANLQIRVSESAMANPRNYDSH
jgi:hypothetical protein